MKVVVPYFGNLSVNNYKIPGTSATRPEVKRWMGQLADKVRDIQAISPVIIKLSGRFQDERVPDLANLHKVLGDALQDGLGINDKEFRFIDVGYTTGCDRPVLEIEIE